MSLLLAFQGGAPPPDPFIPSQRASTVAVASWGVPSAPIQQAARFPFPDAAPPAAEFVPSSRFAGAAALASWLADPVPAQARPRRIETPHVPAGRIFPAQAIFASWEPTDAPLLRATLPLLADEVPPLPRRPWLAADADADDSFVLPVRARLAGIATSSNPPFRGTGWIEAAMSAATSAWSEPPSTFETLPPVAASAGETLLSPLQGEGAQLNPTRTQPWLVNRARQG